MKKKYKLLAKVILIFIVALTANLTLKPADASADFCACNYFLKTGEYKQECYAGDTEYCASWEKDLGADSTVNLEYSESRRPPNCGQVTGCGGLPLVDRVKNNAAPPVSAPILCCQTYSGGGALDKCWNTRPANCQTGENTGQILQYKTCDAISDCAGKIASPSESICDFNGCRVCDPTAGCIRSDIYSTQSQNPLNNLAADLNARKPILQINIPGLKFSDVASSTDDTGTYFYISWIPELISAIYKFGIAIISIVAVVMIIVQGMRVVASGGGEQKAAAYKKILQAVIGLFIAWGSFAILYNINPALVQFNALKVKVVQGIPLSDKETESQNFDTNVISKTELDKLFKAYAGCYGYDWRILKAVALKESGLNPNNLTCPKNTHVVPVPKNVTTCNCASPKANCYVSLFQFEFGSCVSTMGKANYPTSLNLGCGTEADPSFDPEVSTAAGAATILKSLEKINTACSDITTEEAVLLTYLGHNNGPVALDYVLAHGGCKKDQQLQWVRQYYVSVGAPEKQDKGEAKWRYGSGVVDALKSMGMNVDDKFSLTKQSDASTCPRDTGKRAFVAGGGNTSGYKILALGDSITEQSNSHAYQLKAMGYNVTIVAKSGENTQWMLNQINGIDLKSQGFTDLIILGGANDIPGSTLDENTLASNVKSRLTQIYNKAKSAEMRVIALTITPFYNYYGKWSQSNQNALELVNSWIMAGGDHNIDVPIDANTIIADPADKKQILDAYDDFYPTPSGATYAAHARSIHFNAAGHTAIVNAEKAQAFK